MRFISIKIQKIILYIPLINLVLLLIFINNRKYFSINNKHIFKIIIINFISFIILGILITCFEQIVLIHKILKFICLYIFPFIMGNYYIKKQEENNK